MVSNLNQIFVFDCVKNELFVREYMGHETENLDFVVSRELKIQPTQPWRIKWSICEKNVSPETEIWYLGWFQSQSNFCLELCKQQIICEGIYEPRNWKFRLCSGSRNWNLTNSTLNNQLKYLRKYVGHKIKIWYLRWYPILAKFLSWIV